MAKRYRNHANDIIVYFNDFLKKHKQNGFIVLDDNKQPNQRDILNAFNKEYKKELAAIHINPISTNFIQNYKKSIHMTFYDGRWQYDLYLKSPQPKDMVNLKNSIGVFYQADIFVLHLFIQEDGKFHEKDVFSSLKYRLDPENRFFMDYEIINSDTMILYAHKDLNLSYRKIEKLIS